MNCFCSANVRGDFGIVVEWGNVRASMALRDEFCRSLTCWLFVAVCAILHVIAGVASWPALPGLGAWLWGWLIVPDSVEHLAVLGGLRAGDIWLDQEYWRLGSSMLLHGSALHLAFNLSALVRIGGALERRLGHLWVGLTLLVCGLVGAVASVLFSGAGMVVGLSGGIFGLAGFLLVAGWGVGWALSQASDDVVDNRRLGGLLVLCLVGGHLINQMDLGLRLDQAGHLGGLFGGLLVGLMWRCHVKLWGLACLLLVVACYGVLQLGWYPVETRVRLALECLVNGKLVQAQELLEGVRVLDVEDADLLNNLAYRSIGLGVRDLRVRGWSARSIEIGGRQPDYLDTLGWIECRFGNYETGVGLLQEAVLGFGEAVPEEVASHLRDCAAR